METKRRRLLLADDSLTIQKVVQLTFSDEGVDVVAVGDGERAVRELEESGPPDVVLADVNMPGLSGYQVCERIKRDERWRHVPVVLLAGAFEPFDEAEARRVGADEVLTKPFQSIRDLISKVGGLFGGGGEETARSRVQEAAPESAEEPPRQEPEAAPAAADASAAAPEPARREDSFADLGMDDQMIEATPAPAFDTDAGQHWQATPEAFPAEDPEADSWDEERPAPQMETQHVSQPESEPSPAPQEMRAEARHDAGLDSQATRAAYAAFAASAPASDDSLLDLGAVAVTSAPPADTDDFELDIDFDEPPPAAPRRSAPDAAGAFAEAAHGVGASRPWETRGAASQMPSAGGGGARVSAPRSFVEPQVVPSEEPAGAGQDLGVEGDVARPPLGAQTSQAPAAPQPQQLSPEMIDAIARRAVEMLSERVVREIAWEVVPELAERLIRQKLDERK